MGPLAGAALLSSLLAISAEARTFDYGDFRFAEGTVSVASLVWSNASTGIQLAPGPGSFAWTLNASHLRVNITTTKVLEAGRPPDFSRPIYEKSEGTTYRQFTYDSVFANSTSRNRQSEVVAWDPNSTIALTGSTAANTLSGADHSTWIVGGDPHLPVTALTVPASQIEAAHSRGTTTVTGNFSIYVDSATVTVTGATQTDLHTSGNWTEAVAPGTSGPQPARHHYYQRLRLDVTQGVLQIQAQDHAVQWLASELVFFGNLSARFSDATGVLSINGRTQSLANEPLNVDGSGTLRAWNQSATPSGLHANLDLTQGTVASLQTVPLIPPSDDGHAPSGTKLATNAPPHASLWWLPLSAVVLFPIAVFLHRIEPLKPDLLDVEWAVLTGRMRRARRWGRRLMERDPHNPDAMFLYGAALLQQGEYEDLLSRLEPLAENVPRSLRSGIAYILAVSARKAGDRKRARRWGAEATRQPELRTRMQGDGVWADVLRQPAADDLIGRAYA